MCYRTRKTIVNPIIDWTDAEVWEFLNKVAKVPHCSLYDEGFKRLGCIGCPLAGSRNMKREFERWPTYKRAYIRAIEKMIERHPGKILLASGEKVGGWHKRLNSSVNGRSGAIKQATEIVFKWWLNEGQIEEDFINNKEDNNVRNNRQTDRLSHQAEGRGVCAGLGEV